MLRDSVFIAFVATSNARKAREFYEKSLGLKYESGDQFALVFDAHGIMLRIQIVERVEARGYTALGWHVDDIVRKVRALTQRGVQFARYEGMGQDSDGIWTAPSKARVAWFTDPDGNVLSLTQFPSTAV